MAGEKETRPCDFCGQPVTKLLSQRRGNGGWYCSRSCTSKASWRKGLAAVRSGAARDTRPCAVCGTSVTRLLSQSRTETPWTCSGSCSGVLRTRLLREKGTWKKPQRPRTGDHAACEVCGTLFYRSPQRIRQNARFCSPECWYHAQTGARSVKPCLTCGKEMRLRASESEKKYCSKVCESAHLIKRPLDRTHNGRPAKQDKSGYVMVWEPSHPNKSFHGWQYEHRLVVENAIGRYLNTNEHVHHISGVKSDNDISNLEVMDGLEHAAMSARDYRDKVIAEREELAHLREKVAEYEKRFGPLA